MKRFMAVIAAVTLLFNSFAAGVFADTPTSGTTVPKKVMLYVKPDVSVELNGKRQIFKDVNGQTVYPVIYNGTTYLPVRAISAIMKEPIEWDGGSKSVYIGKTLTYPAKSMAPVPSGAAVSVEEDYTFSVPEPSMVTAYSKPDVLVMYDFVIQSFQDINGDTVYPLIYNGSTYLPVRAVSKLMDEPIAWDGAAKKISIGDGEEEPAEPIEEEPEEEDPVEEVSATVAIFKELFEREEILYYEATAKISSIKTSETTEEKQVIAASASENYLEAQAMTLEVKAIDQASFTDAERAAYEKLLAYAESTEYYLLILENIAYLAAADSDYSMLAETFLYFALDSKTKMEEARTLIIQ